MNKGEFLTKVVTPIAAAILSGVGVSFVTPDWEEQARAKDWVSPAEWQATARRSGWIQKEECPAYPVKNVQLILLKWIFLPLEMVRFLTISP